MGDLVAKNSARRGSSASMINSDAVRQLWPEAANATTWKAVGALDRGVMSAGLMPDESEDDGLGDIVSQLQMRTFRSRAASTPNPYSGVSQVMTAALAGGANGWLMGGGPSIWNGSSANSHAENVRAPPGLNIKTDQRSPNKVSYVPSQFVNSFGSIKESAEHNEQLRNWLASSPTKAPGSGNAPVHVEAAVHRRSVTSPHHLLPVATTGPGASMWHPSAAEVEHWNGNASDKSDFAAMSKRRHSFAGPVAPHTEVHVGMPVATNAPVYDDDPYKLMYALDPQLADVAQSVNSAPFLDTIDDYFDNPEHRARAWAKAGRDLQALQSAGGVAHTWPLYVVEFKAGRTDFFYVPENVSIKFQCGDLVIVEADRGKDLGKVIVDNIHSMEQLQIYQNQHQDTLLGLAGPTVRDIVPKALLRKAHSHEVAMLVQKSKDETDALDLAVRRIKQNKLPMQVIDGEFQWDRRKLTFYFVSERRIDFRDLVKELFKIYKTRIWMCQLSPQQIVRRQPHSVTTSY